MRAIAALAGVAACLLFVLVGLTVTEAGHRAFKTAIVGGSHVERGSGHLTTERRDVREFERIESNIGADIMVSIGKPQSVTLTFDDNLIEYVTTSVRGKTLIIDTDQSFSNSDNCRVKIVVPYLERVAINGAGKVDVGGVEGDRFALQINGAADVFASGETGEVAIELNGTGNIDTRDLTAEEATVEINGCGDVHVMARDFLTASINGVGDILYTGNPEHVVKSVDGHGHVRRR